MYCDLRRYGFTHYLNRFRRSTDRLDPIRTYALRRRRSTATPPTAIRMATASSTPSRETAGAGAMGSGVQMPRLPGPGLSQD